jgi:hypothetical protein
MSAMKKILIAAFLLAAGTAQGQTNSQWILEQSTLTYHVSHPLHQTEGVSHAARGKGVCHAGQCDFLVTVPVKSFDSGDSNRDLTYAPGDARRAISFSQRSHPPARDGLHV